MTAIVECRLPPGPQPIGRHPVGLQLSRARGFRLHQASYALNGLPARRVDRASPFGNPFRHRAQGGVQGGAFTETADETAAPADAAAALVALFRHWLETTPEGTALLRRARAELAGHNLACWCALGKPCHRDVLLQVANANANADAGAGAAGA